MGKNKNSKVWILGLIIVLVQVFDILVHVLTNQVEPIRIVSNIIIIAWVLSNIFSVIPLNRAAGFGVLFLYLVLNTIFLFLEGVLNAYGDYRILFFIFILTTLILSLQFSAAYHRQPSGEGTA